MLRRRSTVRPEPTPPSPATGGSTTTAAPRAEELAAHGWVLPKAVLTRGDALSWTLVGTVASPTATAVDPAGLVVGEGWSLDWWIGADDRWHAPAIYVAAAMILPAIALWFRKQLSSRPEA